MIEQLETAQSHIAEEIHKAGTHSKLLYNRRVNSISLPLSTEVMLFVMPTGKKRTCKLQCCWRGPYKVIKVLSNLNYHIQSCTNADDCQVVHLNCLKLFCKYDGLKGDNQTLPVASKESGLKTNKLKEGKSLEQQNQEVVIEEETQGTNKEEYEVEAIKDVRNREDRVEYLVKWKGYTPQHNRWVKERNLHCDDLLVEFLRQQPSSSNKKSKQEKGKEKEVD